MLRRTVQHALAFLYQAASLTVWLVILTLIFLPLERYFALHERRLRSRTLASDLAFYFLNGLAPALIIAAPVALVASTVSRITPSAYVDAVDSLPLGVKIILGLIVSEVGAYWGHRLSHQNKFLWRFHKLHHSPDSMDWLVNTRAHPLDVIFTRLCGLAPLYALGLATSRADGQIVPALVTIAGTFWAFFIHANLKWRFGPLEWLVSTPHFHHWHHTNDQNRDHNYAALFPVVDRIFGTHFQPRHWPPVYGVDEPARGSFGAQLLDPLSSPVRPVASAAPSKARSET